MNCFKEPCFDVNDVNDPGLRNKHNQKKIVEEKMEKNKIVKWEGGQGQNQNQNHNIIWIS